MQIRKQTYQLHAEHVAHPAVIVSIEPDTGKFGNQLKWTLQEPNGQTIVGWTGANLSSNSKLGKWVRAFYNGTIPDVFDTDNLIGKPCGFVVSHITATDGDIRDRVEVVLPRQPTPTQQHVAAVAEAMDELGTDLILENTPHNPSVEAVAVSPSPVAPSDPSTEPLIEWEPEDA